MTRKNITEAVLKLQRAIADSGLIEALERSMRKEDSTQSSVLLSALKDFTISYEKFDDTERKIIDIFDLSELTSPESWMKFLTERGSLVPIRIQINMLKNFLPKILLLFQQEYADILTTHKKDPEFLGQDMLTVILPEEGSHFSKPLRLSSILESIVLLYSVCATIKNESPDQISVISIDSGSDKSFDFLGNAKVIECLKDLLLQVWDRIVFFRERKMGERIELISKSLPLLEQVGKMEQNGTIGPEQAEILKRSLLEGTNKFISTGAITPDLDRNSSYNPRRLMAPEPKMITEKSSTSDDVNDNTQGQSQEKANQGQTLTEEEKKVFEELLKKMRGGDTN